MTSLPNPSRAAAPPSPSARAWPRPRDGRRARLDVAALALAGSLLGAALAMPAPARAQAQTPAAAATARPAAPVPSAAAAQRVRAGDWIVAVVNTELVTAAEVDARVQRAREDAARAGQRLPPDAELRRLATESLIEERVVVTHARESGARIEDTEVDRAVQSVAQQNQITTTQLRERLRAEGLDWARFRANLRDQMMVERIREREVYQRIRVTDAEIDRFLDQQRGLQRAEPQVNLAQILVTVPEGADEATVAARRARIEAALTRLAAGEDFARVAAEVSEDGNKERGGEIGLRPVSRLPDLFTEASKGLAAGQYTRAPVRSGAGFHVLKVVERTDGGELVATQTRARHILIRTSVELSAEVAARRLAEFRRQIEAGQRRFEDLARQHSEDGSAVSGGELGWASPGQYVPEFEDAMNRLPVGGISQPVQSRFGLHLIQVLERRDVPVEPRQIREQARNAVREQKFAAAYGEWVKDLRARAYVEMREPPQ